MKLVNLKEAAQAVGLSPYALRQGALSGIYPCYRAGRRRLFSVEAIEDVVRAGLTVQQQETRESRARSV